MPYTLSHVAAIIPLNKKPMVLSALIIGCMSPDFLYFLPYLPYYDFTHTFFGLIFYCVPASLIVYFIFHRVMRQPLTSLLPPFIQQHCLYGSPSKSLKAIVLSVALGAATHIIWDSFTHASGFVVKRSEILSAQIFIVSGQPVYLFSLLQYLSTVVGGMVVAIWAVSFTRKILPEGYSVILAIKQTYKLMIMLVASGLVGITYPAHVFALYGVKFFVVQSAIVTTSTFVVLASAYCTWWYIRKRYQFGY